MTRSLAAILLFLAAALPAAAQTAVDLGPAATNGQAAHDGFAERAQRLHLVMACGNEYEFVQGFVLASRFGKKGFPDDPATGAKEPDLAAWPLTLVLGKAAVLADASIDPTSTAVGRPVCHGALAEPAAVIDAWRPLARCRSPDDPASYLGQPDSRGRCPEARALPRNAPAQDVVNRVYEDWFGFRAEDDQGPCSSVAYVFFPPGDSRVQVSLTRACLARQIRAVLLDDRHGPWTEEGGTVTPEVAGTDGLPCLSEFSGADVKGDWDMGVLEYTRIAHVLYRVAERGHGVGFDVDKALERLNTRFLSLRSSPGDATARETFNLVFDCGNEQNQYGSAVDTVDGTGSDPGVGRYNEDGSEELDPSFWDSFWRFLASLLIVVAAAAVAWAIGAALATIALAGGATAAAAAVAAVVAIVVILGSVLLVSLDETENHLLMQNTSRYLKNKLMMAELARAGNREAFDTVADLNDDVREWLLERMQRIAEEDFLEYNAKPYARLSHFSLLNLIDYACDVRWNYDLAGLQRGADAPCDDKDKAVVTAAAALFDLSAAKAAVGSLEGRRLIPFRRRSEVNQQFYDGRPLTELVAGADTMIAALQMWTGNDIFAPGGKAQPATFGQLSFYSTSRYRPDPMILDIAIDKSTPRAQQYRHFGREAYVSGNGWLLTAGGDDEGRPAGANLPLGIKIYIGAPATDYGVGVPTTLMTRAPIVIENGQPRPRNRVRDFLRFDGKDVDFGFDDGKPLKSFSNNNCIAGAFVCGLRPRLPDDFSPSCWKSIDTHFYAIDSTRCFALDNPDDRADIFVALYDHDGIDVDGSSWGFLEVAQQDRFGRSLDAFIDAVKAKNAGRVADWEKASADDDVTYTTTDDRTLEFEPEDEDFGADRRACGVVNHEGDSRFTISAVPAAEAANCRSVGRRIYIDLDDEEKPVRKAEEGGALDDLF